MERNENDSIEMKLIQLAADKYVVQHPCILSEMKTIKIGEDVCIIYSNNTDPVFYSARILDLWQEVNVLYLKLWNYRKDKMEMYLQDLSTDKSLFFFVSKPFITQLSEIMTGISYPENSNEIPSIPMMKTGSNLQDDTELPEPFYNSCGNKILEFISTSEIILDLPIINTRNKRLKLNMPYLKTEKKLSGNDICAVRLLSFETSDAIIQLKIQELKNKKTYTIEWKMDYAGSYWLWSLTDFETAIYCP